MTYQRPGVYINTSLTPLTPGASAPGQSTAAFVGMHTEGPTLPTLVSSWTEFTKLYGGFGDAKNYLPFAVWSYFANNGNQCYVIRANNSDAVAATQTLNDREVGGGAIQPPTNVAAAPSGTVGSVTSVYGYVVTALNALGETLPSTPEVTVTANATLTSSSGVTVTWTPVIGATGYSIYRRTLPTGYGEGDYGGGIYGGALEVALKLTSVSGQATSSFLDDGSYTPMGDLPTANTTGQPVPILKLSCISVGAWGNKLYVEISDSISGNGRFNVILRKDGTADANIVEQFVDLSMDPTDNRYAIAMINSTTLGSKYVTAQFVGTWTVWDATKTPQVQPATPLSGGSDGTTTSGTLASNLLTATQRLATYEQNVDLNIAGVSDTAVLNPIMAWTATKDNLFMVIDVPPAVVGTDGATVSEAATVAEYINMVSGSNKLTPTADAAVYGPWLKMPDPLSAVQGATRTLPPGGSVLGRYSQTDALTGVEKAPAGVDIPLQRTVGVELAFQNANLDTLNTNQVNIIRNVPGYGYCIMGARTLLSNMPNRYVSIERTLMNIRQSLRLNTIFAVFDDNTPALWARLSAVVSQYLQGIWQQGMLSGATAEEAFFVLCDETNNTATTIAAGEVHIQVGLALVSPAEFVVIDINQMSSSTTTTA